MRFILLGILASFYTIFCEQLPLNQKAEQVLDKVVYTLPAPSIIGKHEWKELQLDRLVTMLDHTTTSFGRWGLVQLLHPIADTEELSRRKEIITFLIEHEDEMQLFQEQLKRVHELEKSLLSYWDENDQLNESAKQFYYGFIGAKELNKSSIALNVGAVSEIFTAWQYLLASLALGGLTAEFQRWIYGEQDSMNIAGGLYEGLKLPLRQHSLYPVPGVIDPKESYGYKDWIKANFFGSWRDRYNVLYTGFSPDFSAFGLPFKTAKPKSASMLGAFIGATIPTLFFDYQWANSIVSASKRIMSMYRSLNELQNRVADVAQCIDAIQKLQKTIVEHAPELDSSVRSAHDDYVLKRNKLLKDLLVPRFLAKSDYLYSRGHVLTMHLQLMQQKKTLIPLLQSIALLDAYCSIAQLYKESQNAAVTFSFPEFVESEKPFLSYRAAWLPLLPQEQAVTNDLFLGGAEAGKMIITGPNGSGKSTILKTLGIMPILAQSWCIVPAQHAQQAVFTSIVTNLAADEDLSHGLSKGTAGLKAMDEIGHAIDSSDGERVLVLIDEPYAGMPDVEAARRIYLFGKDVAQYSNILVSIATHTKRPMQLAQDTAGIFSNYQVKINEIRHGEFERLFKLEKGSALWWFEDEDRRSRFVDWLANVK